MAAHSLSIAKASLLASCLRPDVTKLGRDDLANLHNLLEASINKCTPWNIQNTKAWLLQHILPSPVRTTAFAKYLTSLSKNFSNVTVSTEDTCRPCRQQLHLLYLINDLFHHSKFHGVDEALRNNTYNLLAPALPDLFARAAVEQKKGTRRRLVDLIQIWQSANYCDPKVLTQLQEVVSTGTALSVGENGDKQIKQTPKEQPWIMPSTHGDPTAPFFDLPAANLMPHIMPNSTRPMRPADVRALQLNAGTVDESLVNALKDFLKDVNAIDDPYAALEDEGIVPDIDEMGQISHKNEADDIVGDTYYGWSRAFCERMKRRGGENNEGRRGRSTNSSRSESLSYSPRKRRRYSSSMSRSRSPSPVHERDTSRPRFGSGPKGPSPPAPVPQPSSDPRLRFGQNSQPPSTIPHQFSPQPMPNFTSPMMGHNGMLVPPPRPPNWQGPWPPPPPPPPPSSHGGSAPYSGMPFPPPPPPQGFNQQNYGRR